MGKKRTTSVFFGTNYLEIDWDRFCGAKGKGGHATALPLSREVRTPINSAVVLETACLRNSTL